MFGWKKSNAKPFDELLGEFVRPTSPQNQSRLQQFSRLEEFSLIEDEKKIGTQSLVVTE